MNQDEITLEIGEENVNPENNQIQKVQLSMTLQAKQKSQMEENPKSNINQDNNNKIVKDDTKEEEQKQQQQEEIQEFKSNQQKTQNQPTNTDMADSYVLEPNLCLQNIDLINEYNYNKYDIELEVKNDQIKENLINLGDYMQKHSKVFNVKEEVQSYVNEQENIFKETSKRYALSLLNNQKKHLDKPDFRREFEKLDKYIKLPESEEPNFDTNFEGAQLLKQNQLDHIEQNPLNNQMLQSIAKSGQFEVPSNLFSYPYKWQLSQWLIKGSIKRIKAFYFDYSISYRNMYYITNRFYQDKKENTWQNALLHPQFAMGFFNILMFPVQLLGLIIGLPGWYSDSYVYKQQYVKKLEEQRQTKLCDQLKDKLNPNEIEQFYLIVIYILRNQYIQIKQNPDELDVEFRQRKQRLQQEKQAFLNQLYNQLNDINNDINNQKKTYEINNKPGNNIDYYQELNKKFNQDLQLDKIEQQNIFKDKNTFQAYKNLLLASQIINYYEEECQKTLQDVKYNEIKYNIKKNHPIKARFPKYWSKETSRLFNLEVKKLQNERDQKILKALGQQNLQIYQIMYQDYQENYDNGQNFKKVKDKVLYKQCKKYNTDPIRIRKVRRKLLCKKVVQDKNTKLYRFEKYSYYYVKSTVPFWRILLFFLRWFGWGSNTSLWLMKQATIGQFGIKALFYCNNKYYRHTILDMKTGEVKPDKSRSAIRPVCYIFGNVMKGIKRSRHKFETAPDTGFFPKGCSRYCNLIECYIYRFFFIGVIGTLICMPIIILINFFVCLALAITSLVYMPVVLALVMVFQWLIFDFDNKRTYKWLPLSQVTKAPLFYYIFVDLLIRGVIQLVWSIILFVFHLVVSILFTIWGVLRLVMRTVYDCICMQCIKCNGRVPATDTALAWKYGGPGIGDNMYSEIGYPSIQNLFLLHLETLYLNNFKEIQTQLIHKQNNQQINKIQQLFRLIKGIYQPSQQDLSPIIGNLNYQVNNRIYSYRKYIANTHQYQVKFKKQSLETYLPKTQNLIIDYCSRKDMTFIWKKLQIQKENYQDLNEQLWKNIFSHNILEPYEQFEERIEVKKDLSEFTQAQNVLKGKGLDHKTQNVKIKDQKQQKQIQYNFSSANPPSLAEVFNLLKIGEKNRIISRYLIDKDLFSKWYKEQYQK